MQPRYFQSKSGRTKHPVEQIIAVRKGKDHFSHYVSHLLMIYPLLGNLLAIGLRASEISTVAFWIDCSYQNTKFQQSLQRKCKLGLSDRCFNQSINQD